MFQGKKTKGVASIAVITIAAAMGASLVKAEPASNPDEEIVVAAEEYVAEPAEWAEYTNSPNPETMANIALAPTITQDGSRITIIPAPQGFDSAAYVVSSDGVGVYLIDNVEAGEAAIERANALEVEISEIIPMAKIPAEANAATAASSFLPSEDIDLKLLNVIVAPDLIAGNTVTVAFTYPVQ